MTVNFERLDVNDASKLVSAWGKRANNFTYLTSSVLNDIAQAQRYVNKALARPDNLAFHIIEDNKTLGLVKAGVENHRALVGYVIDEEDWGRGVATLAVEFITQQLKANNQIQRIWATCALENAGSIRVLEKCGYEREGVLKNWVVYPSQGSLAQDNYVYSYPLG